MISILNNFASSNVFALLPWVAGYRSISAHCYPRCAGEHRRQKLIFHGDQSQAALHYTVSEFVMVCSGLRETDGVGCNVCEACMIRDSLSQLASAPVFLAIN